MCGNIERCIFRVSLNGTHFFYLEEHMKKKLTLVLVILLGLCFCLCGCGLLFDDNNGQATTDQIQSVQAPEYNCKYTRGLGYHVTISGALKNVSKSQFSYVSITFTLYDDNGYNIGSAMANMNYLGAGETWRYEAISLGWFDNPPASYKCSDITCF